MSAAGCGPTNARAVNGLARKCTLRQNISPALSVGMDATQDRGLYRSGLHYVAPACPPSGETHLSSTDWHITAALRTNSLPGNRAC
ncbi:hypothetical protein CKAH01_06637 [Colletotrichum kahawae]|uniref:Uncharacterized protein n=1 Tax=Colletotrichum kahawae TaxID=34407 RepID=A0AAD9Y726_COLKA|nr:hypothetical protein CKAH01_06637 [Colletotrichum kahawae]